MKGSFWGCKKQVIIHLKHSYQSSTLTVFCFFYTRGSHEKKKSLAEPYRTVEMTAVDSVFGRYLLVQRREAGLDTEAAVSARESTRKCQI